MSAQQTSVNRSHQWQQHIEGWQSSGHSKARYCRNNDLNYSMFNYWLAKLITSKKKTTNLVPVAVNPAIGAKDAGTLQLELPNGMQITGISTDSVDIVRRLIAQL